MRFRWNLEGSGRYSIIVAIAITVTFISMFVPLLFVRANSYTFDEAYSVYIARMSWIKMEKVLLFGAESHPPLYDNLLKVWMSFSTFYPWILLLHVLCAMCTLVVVYRICVDNFNEKIGLFSVLIISTSSFFFWAGRYIRMYSLFLMLTSLSTYYFFKLLQKPGKRARCVTVLYILSNASGMYTHWFFIHVIISQVLFLVLYKHFRKLLVTHVFICLLCAPLSLFVISEVRVMQYAGGFIWGGEFTIDKLFELVYSITTTKISLIVFLVVVGSSFYKRKKTPEQIKFLLVLSVLPILQSILIESITGWYFFVNRYFIFLLISIPIVLSYFAVISKSRVVTVLLIIAISYNFFYIMKDNFSLLQDELEVKEGELAEDSRYDLVLHMTPFTFFPSRVYEWESKEKHKLIYDTSLEKNPILEYAIKSGVIDKSDIVQSCGDLINKTVFLKTSSLHTWINPSSTKALLDKCYTWDNKSNQYTLTPR